MSIQSFSDLLTHLGLGDKPPRRIECRTTSEITDWLRAAWNFGHAAGVKETRDEYNAKALLEIEEADYAVQAEAQGYVAEPGVYLAASERCTRECKRRLRH
jgi:hypothetical protein